MKDDDEVHTWLVTVDLNESPQSPEKSDPSFFLFYYILYFLKRQKKSQLLSFTIDKICKIAFHGKISFYGTKLPFTEN